MDQRTEVISELREVEKDLAAFRSAKAILLQRADEMPDSRRETFLQWAVSQVILNSLVIGTVRCEGLIEDYRKYLSEQTPDNVVTFRRC